MTIEIKHYKPGDPEFDEIAKTVTYNDHTLKNKKDLHSITADFAPFKRKRYTEKTDKI